MKVDRYCGSADDAANIGCDAVLVLMPIALPMSP